MKKGFGKTDLVTLMAMAAFIGFSVSIAGGFYKFVSKIIIKFTENLHHYYKRIKMLVCLLVYPSFLKL